jgi:pimeloyl-ACP methyl ester carboxylesterase
MIKPTTKFAEHRSLRVAYSVEGPKTGEVIVLQHGWTSEKEFFAAYAEALVSAGFQCISIDSLGHGESDKPNEAQPYARTERAAHVVAVLNKEEIDKAHFIGYSMGGWIACCMAEHHSDRLLSLMIGGHCPETGTNEEAGGLKSGEDYTFDRITELYDFDWPDELKPAMKHTYEYLEDVSGHEKAVAESGVPVLLWKGRGEVVICEKGEQMAERNGWSFFSVEGDHMQAALNHEANLPHLLKFIKSGGI